MPQDTNICIIEQPTESTLKYTQIIDGVDSVKDLELVRGTQKGEWTNAASGVSAQFQDDGSVSVNGYRAVK